MKAFLFSVIIISQLSFAQSLKCRIGGNMDIHMKDKETQYENSPFQQDVEQPSIASFYDDAAGWFLDLSFRFGNSRTEKGQFFAGFNYSRCSIEANSQASLILGENILKIKYFPYLGFGGYIDQFEYYTFIYGFGGFVFKNYSGEGKLPIEVEGIEFIVDGEYKYLNALSARLGGGIDFENLGDSPITLGLQLSIEFGTIKRGNIDLYYNGERIGEAYPTGETSLSDNTIYISASLGYQINW